MRGEIFYQLALQLIPNIGNANAKYIISYCGSAEKAFHSDKNKLLRIPGIGTKTIKSIQEKSSLKKAEEIIRDCEKSEIRIIHYLNQDYPERLKPLIDAPNIIYIKGAGNVNPERSIAIVGTRNATIYGKNIAQKIVNELKPYNATVISGLAYGIDIEAHLESLKLKIPTFAILAGGLDKIYPSIHKKIALNMLDFGGLISENPPGTKPEAHLFPARNRIIAGMTDATIVVEAADKGGALITANIADSYDRPVFAVPGNIGSPFSNGCNKIIQSQKALIYTRVDDLVYYLNWDEKESVNSVKKQLSIALDTHEKKLVELLQSNESITIDDLSWKSQMQINQVASVLLNLEFKGIIKSLPGKKYKMAI